MSACLSEHPLLFLRPSLSSAADSLFALACSLRSSFLSFISSFVRFSPNGKYILASSFDSTLRLWDYTHKDHCVKNYSSVTDYSNRKFCVASAFSTLHAEAQYVVSGNEEGSLLLWEVKSTDVVSKLRPPPKSGAGGGPVLAVALHPTLPIIASAAMDAPFAIVLWAHAQ